MLSKMLKANAKKTASARKPVFSIWYVVFGLVLVCGFLFLTPKSTKLSLNDKTFFVEVAKDKNARAKGLSGREKLLPYHGMLFVFDSPGKHCFWMKDMKFSLDIIWIDESKTVVDVAKYVSPQTYPEFFCPSRPAKYTLEVAAGSIEQAGLEPGTLVQF